MFYVCGKGGSKMAQVEIREDGHAVVAMLSGEIDHHTAQRIRASVDEYMIGSGAKSLILDFSGVTFMDSSGVGLILGRRRLMESLGGTVAVRGVPAQLRRIMTVAGIRIK